MTMLAIPGVEESNGLIALFRGLGWTPATREIPASKWSDVEPVALPTRRPRPARRPASCPAAPERLEEDPERWDGLS